MDFQGTWRHIMALRWLKRGTWRHIMALRWLKRLRWVDLKKKNFLFTNREPPHWKKAESAEDSSMKTQHKIRFSTHFYYRCTHLC
jgi:hypothetical protein